MHLTFLLWRFMSLKFSVKTYFPWFLYFLSFSVYVVGRRIFLMFQCLEGLSFTALLCVFRKSQKSCCLRDHVVFFFHSLVLSFQVYRPLHRTINPRFVDKTQILYSLKITFERIKNSRCWVCLYISTCIYIHIHAFICRCMQICKQ